MSESQTDSPDVFKEQAKRQILKMNELLVQNVMGPYSDPHLVQSMAKEIITLAKLWEVVNSWEVLA